ncbi:hypothetical protein GCM10018790_64770 [Kitasatospora xanthocidica]|uniref:hypothetical protein n=1 Tax=Kitasatospora xanthocidica TaxID=83382 RepID=UPI001679714D|nr:hypothetical protein [Kitasatospora xanthocidica]GHF77690.1 hypothetical protein GCM10018790_64770 [Kitasatospora xanthocidica]
MTNLNPNRIPGYESGLLADLPDLLDDPLFWPRHLYSCAQGEEREELLFGADYDAALDFHDRMLGHPHWPVFTVPVAAGCRLHIVYRNLPDDAGTDYLLHHPDWDRAELLASDDGHFMGPALSWSELTAAADNGLAGGSTADPHARLLLLLPAFGDTAVPDGAVGRLTAALLARTAVEDPERLAAAMLEDQGPCGRVRWSATRHGFPINDGGHAYRNPANDFSLPADRLGRVAAALAS